MLDPAIQLRTPKPPKAAPKARTGTKKETSKQKAAELELAKERRRSVRVLKHGGTPNRVGMERKGLRLGVNKSKSRDRFLNAISGILSSRIAGSPKTVADAANACETTLSSGRTRADFIACAASLVDALACLTFLVLRFF